MQFIIDIVLTLVMLGAAYYALHRFKHTMRCWKLPPAPEPPAPSKTASHVCIQCPVYNEPFVIEALLESVSRIEWNGTLSIQILDDSNDETTELIQGWMERTKRNDFQHIRREHRKGYKAGALLYGMQQTDAEFFAVFDADFRPDPQFLHRVMSEFADPQVGAVQARWEYGNRKANLLTWMQGVILDVHFLIEQWGRSSAGLYFNFNGTAGVWRRKTIDDAGSWSADTVTEDLDLSYRAQRRGWKFKYLCNYAVQSELPQSLTAFKTQQHRWTKGGVQVARTQLVPSLRSHASREGKSEALSHLTIGLVHPLTTCFCFLALPYLYLRSKYGPTGMSWIIDSGTILVVFALPVMSYIGGQYFRTRSIRECLKVLILYPALIAFGFGINVNYTYAFWEGLVSSGGEFARTPKGGKAARNPRLLGLFTRSRRNMLLVATEFAVGVGFAAATVGLRSQAPLLWIVLLATVSIGHLWVATQSLVEKVSVATR